MNYDGTETFWLEEVEWRTWKKHDYGGQQVGVDCSVIAHHIPTGICVIGDSERSQFKNKQFVMERLRQILEVMVPILK